MQGGFDGTNLFNQDEAELTNAAVDADMNSSTRGLNNGPNVKAYAKALEKESPLPPDVYDLIAHQKSLLKGSHDLIRQFRDQYAEV